MRATSAWRARWGAACILATALAASLAVSVAVAAGEGDGAAPAPAAPGAAVPAAPKPPSATVRIVFTVLPSSKKATVTWGKKKLGVIAPHAPLIVQRPRDSGPLDVVVKSDGCVTVQTRAYTFEDSKVSVKLTPNDQKNTLLGYREEQPESDGGVPAGALNPDAGAN
jgi:hypothetical protein